MVCKYNIRTSSHYNKIFLLCHLTDQITLIEENSILNWKSMIFLEILEELSNTCIFLNLSFEFLYIIAVIFNILFFSIHSLQNLVKNFCIIVIDFQLICQCKTNIGSGTSMCTTNTNDQMIIR